MQEYNVSLRKQNKRFQIKQADREERFFNNKKSSLQITLGQIHRSSVRIKCHSFTTRVHPKELTGSDTYVKENYSLARDIQRERERQRDRERQRERQRDREIERQKERKKERERERVTAYTQEAAQQRSQPSRQCCASYLSLLASNEISKFDQYHGYLSSVSLRLQMIYSNTWILWFTRQLDLELMFSSVIPLRTANWNK